MGVFVDDLDYYFESLFMRACGRFVFLPERLRNGGGAQWVYLELLDDLPPRRWLCRSGPEGVGLTAIEDFSQETYADRDALLPYTKKHLMHGALTILVYERLIAQANGRPLLEVTVVESGETEKVANIEELLTFFDRLALGSPGEKYLDEVTRARRTWSFRAGDLSRTVTYTHLNGQFLGGQVFSS